MTLFSLKGMWKYPVILLGGIGISNIGAWVYLLSLNLFLYEWTGSAFTIVILYILGPAAALITNAWAGSVIDRHNKRLLMIGLDLVRALFIFIMPFLQSVFLIFAFALFINMANSIFKPASMSYITKLIPSDQRKKFNSLMTLVTSGAFLIGPAFAGLLLMISTPLTAIYLTAFAFLISGLVTFFMPDIEKNLIPRSDVTPYYTLMKKDWTIVALFSRSNPSILIIYFLFSSVMIVLASAVDSLEVAFSKEVLHLSNAEYGFLVSVAGAGILAGSGINLVTQKRFSLFTLMSYGTIGVAVGYIIFSFSNTLLIAVLGCFSLAFFISFANTGFLTFYQNYIPAEVMGRVGSLYGFAEAVFMIAVTLVLGVLTYLFPLQIAVRIGTVSMLCCAVFLSYYLFMNSTQFTSDGRELKTDYLS